MKARRTIATLFAAAGLMLFGAASAEAATVTVATGGDTDTVSTCTLRQAMASVDIQSNQGGCFANITDPYGTNDVINIPASVGPTITLIPAKGELFLDQPATITGPGSGQLAIDGNDGTRVFHIGSSSAVSISGLTIKGGSVVASPTAEGGGIYSESALTLDDVVVTDNAVDATVTSPGVFAFADGGGVYTQGQGPNITDSKISGNTATATNTAGDTQSAAARGAGIFINLGTGPAELHRTTIADNTASAEDDAGADDASAIGGLLSVGPVTLDRSSVVDNSADAEADGGAGASVTTTGGLFLTDNSTVGLSTVAGNTAAGAASLGTVNATGGVATGGNPTTTAAFKSSTIAQNGSPGDGANIDTGGSGNVTLADTIVADPGNDLLNCAGGGITSLGYNVDYSPAGPSCVPVTLGVPTIVGDQVTDPLLDPNGWNYNGGPTPTIALLPASPAIDAGLVPGGIDATHDQRGLTRPVDFSGVANATGGDGSDIGAFEVQRACATQNDPKVACPAPPGGGGATPPGPTGERAAALKKCKKKHGKKRKKCVKRAKRLPV